MASFVSVPPVIAQTYKVLATNRAPSLHKNLGITSKFPRLSRKLWCISNIHSASCTVATERHSLKKGAAKDSYVSPSEKNVDQFLAEKGYKLDDTVILFDGECNLCNGSVNFVLDHDKEGIFKFAALQSPVGLALLQKYNGPTDLSSLVLIEKGHLLLKSDAILRIAELLDNQSLRILAVATRWGFPRWLRDWVYTEIISKYRRQVFGETDSCRLMEPGWEHRFL